MFDNAATVGESANLGKYFIDRNGNGLKDGTCTTSTADECYVDVWFNYAEGNLKGTYTAVTADEKSKVKPQAKKAVIFGALYNYETEAAFAKRVDNSMAGQMRDCAECHVGGGAMEHVPVAQGTLLADGARIELRTNQTGTIVGTGVNTYNYFIDQYDDNNDGKKGEVLPQNYADTGVLEMDCLICHLEGYSWDNRKEAIRKGNFDASRVAGAKLGAADNVVAGSSAGAGYGKKVTYDPLMVITDGAGNATLSALALNAIVGTPLSANCSACHFDLHKVDWKKRGDTWHPNMSYEYEVHGSLGCMGCHARTDNLTMDPVKGSADNPLWTGNATSGDASKTLGHDPSKGNAPYGAIWNANDNTVRTCAGCHIDTSKSYYGTGGAPDPTNVHKRMGLTQTLIQTKGMGKMDGIANGNHLDIIMCEGCHSRKVGHGPLDSHSLYEWGTGGAMVDGSGPDPEGRMTDHENLYVERTMENNLGIAWSGPGGNKLGPRNALVSMFWLNKDDDIDINADGQLGGLDPVNPMHVRNALAAAEPKLHALTADGNMSEAQIIAQKEALRTYLADPEGVNIGNSSKLKLSLMGVFFKSSHGTTPAANAWGAGGCQDCHGANKGFYNGPYDLKPRDLQASWSNKGAIDYSAVEGGQPGWKYVVPFTAVNVDNYSGRDLARPICSTYYGPNPRPALPTMGTIEQIGDACTEGGTNGIWTVYALGKIKADQQFTDFHPTTWAKGQVGRSIAITAAMGEANTIRTMDRSEGLWEAKFVNGTYNGAIKGTDGKLYTTRADWVNYLNNFGNYPVAMHLDHKEYACSTCHSDGDGGTNLTFALVSDESLNAAEQFTFTENAPGVLPTCTTACHLVASIPAASKATARISATHAIDKNFKVALDGSKSACYGVNPATGAVTQGAKTYAWTIAGEGVDTDCATAATCTATWPAAGTNNVSLKVSCSPGGVAIENTAIQAVTGFDVGAGDNVDLVLSYTVNEEMVATLKTAGIDPDVYKVQILWGDGTLKSVLLEESDPSLADFDTSVGGIGIQHTYAASGTYSVTVTTNNAGTNSNKNTYYETIVVPAP